MYSTIKYFNYTDYCDGNMYIVFCNKNLNKIIKIVFHQIKRVLTDDWKLITRYDA